jgi:predicted RNase H-like nuclease (RuvC/YqgF family)
MFRRLALTNQVSPLCLFNSPCLCLKRIAGAALKKHRNDAVNSPQQIDFQKVVDSQTAEIEFLKTDKANLENSVNSLRGEHEKVLHENKILKRAVTIQQERQNQASAELHAARQFKEDAEERIRKLEQLVLSLRYHLQAQHMNTPGNDFMGFPPPNVY